MIKWFNIKFGARYWYSVRFIYKNKHGERLFDFVNEVGLVEKQTILNHRSIKKIIKPLHGIKSIPKYLMCNGSLSIEVTSYLGWFKYKLK